MSSIRGKLLFGFVLMLSFIVVQSLVTYFYFDRNQDLIDQAVERDFRANMEISRVAIEGQKIRRYEKEYFIYINHTKKSAKYRDEFNETYTKLETLLDSMLVDSSGTWSRADKEAIRQWREALVAYGLGFREVVRKFESGDIANTVEANRAIQDAKNKFRVLLKGTAKSSTEKFDNATRLMEEIAANSRVVTWVVLGSFLSGVLLVLALMLTIPGSITKSVDHLNEVARRMSTGDLDQKVPPSDLKEFVELAKTLERMRVSQKAMLDRMKRAA